jgi:hypothetical protein
VTVVISSLHSNLLKDLLSIPFHSLPSCGDVDSLAAHLAIIIKGYFDPTPTLRPEKLPGTEKDVWRIHLRAKHRANFPFSHTILNPLGIRPSASALLEANQRAAGEK